MKGEVTILITRALAIRKPVDSVITLRLRPAQDSDLIAYLDTLPRHINRSDILRDALREYVVKK